MDNEIQMKMRMLALRRRKGLFALLAGCLCPFLLILLPNNGAWWVDWVVTICIVGTIFLIIYGLIVWIGAVGRLKDIISEAFVPEALGKVFAQVEYQQNSHIPKESIDEALIQHYWESTRGNDYVRADYRGIPIEFSDISLTYETGTGEKSRTRSAFCGPYFICSFAQSFPAELMLICRKKVRPGFEKKLEGMYPISSGYDSLDDNFLLITDNLQGALSILTPRAAESIFRLHVYTKGRCSLKLTCDGKVYVAVDSGHSAFEPGKRIEEAERRIAEELSCITDIIDFVHGAFA